MVMYAQTMYLNHKGIEAPYMKKSNTTMHTVIETKSFFFHLIFHKCKTYVSANNWLRQASKKQLMQAMPENKINGM